MGTTTSLAEATGLSSAHVVRFAEGQALAAETLKAFQRLQSRACSAGLSLTAASTWRSYQRQLRIFNTKASGERQVHDDAGLSLTRADFSEVEWLMRILRFSALPGTSRHHWGTDLDVFDRDALPDGAALHLTPGEYAPGGHQHPLASWLLERIQADDAEGFYLPYAADLGGVAPEPWHLSYRPGAEQFARWIQPDMIEPLWRGDEGEPPISLLSSVLSHRDDIWRRYCGVG